MLTPPLLLLLPLLSALVAAAVTAEEIPRPLTLGDTTPQPPLLRSFGWERESRGGGAFCYPSPADTAAAQLGAGMGVQFGGWGLLGK